MRTNSDEEDDNNKVSKTNKAPLGEILNENISDSDKFESVSDINNSNKRDK